jgi:urease accessory protein
LITVEKIIGNIKNDDVLREKYDEMCRKQLCQKIKISRLESERIRMRKTSDKGADVALILPPDTRLRHGDIIVLSEDKIIIVEIEPENVAIVEIKDNLHQNDIVEIPVRVGHTIGNLHRPIKLERNKIYFPIQADTELEMFEKLFSNISDHLEIKRVQMVFEPEEATEAHEH